MNGDGDWGSALKCIRNPARVNRPITSSSRCGAEEGVIVHREVPNPPESVGAVEQHLDLRPLDVEPQQVDRPVQVIAQAAARRAMETRVVGPFADPPGVHAVAAERQRGLARPDGFRHEVDVLGPPDAQFLLKTSKARVQFESEDVALRVEMLK